MKADVIAARAHVAHAARLLAQFDRRRPCAAVELRVRGDLAHAADLVREAEAALARAATTSEAPVVSDVRRSTIAIMEAGNG